MASPMGAYTNSSRACSIGVFRSVMSPMTLQGLHAVATQHGVAVGQLARMLHEEARLADELARLLGQDLLGPVAPVLAVGRLLALLLVVDDAEPLLEDDVQAGLDVV